MLTNQSCLESFGLIEELDEHAAETISGGYEVFTIKNTVGFDVNFSLDDTPFTLPANETWYYTAYSGGIVEFDSDKRGGYELYKEYDLAEGGVYEFQDDPSPGNPYDFNLYTVA
ncbi:MAG: hypothetical protein KME55_25660 [Nostoc indistinguendum CM1-VF10]|jgi:hypothetical protein|nr:hypothetical protein [Nostoc indistinguendum CM1-VF10]